MPTTRRRHAITETPEIAGALDAAARAWPDAASDRAELMRRLIIDGGARADEERQVRLNARRAAFRRVSGGLAGVYPPHALEELRADWPE